MMQLLEIGISNALAATCLAFVVAAVTRFYRQPPVVFCLWLLVLIKLVTPPLFQVPLSVLASRPEARFVEAIGQQPIESVSASQPLASTSSALNPPSSNQPVSRSTMTAGAPAAAPTTAYFYWRECLCMLWYLGTLLYLSLAIHRMWRFQKLLRLTSRAPQELCDTVRNLAKSLNLRSQPWIRISDGNVSPLVWCLAPTERPVIVLPRTLLSQLSADQQTSLLAHELAHLRRGDHWVRWFELVVTGLFWWHPVVWWARREMHRAGDQCCDAWVLWAFPQRARTYAEALLTTIDFLAEAKPVVPPLASTIGQAHFLERRIQMILRHVPRKDLSRTSQLLLLVAATVILPVSSRLVAQDETETKDTDKPATARAEPGSTKKLLAAKADAADEKPKVAIPRAGILEVEITIGDKTTKTKSLKGAASQLRKQARSIAQAETFSTVININGTTREFKDSAQAITACDAVARILNAMKRSRIQLGELGRIEPTQLPALGQQQTGIRRGRDGDDGVGVGGGLGGQSGGNVLGGLGSGGAGGQGGGKSKERSIATSRQAISQVLIDASKAQQQKPKSEPAESPSDGVARSGKATLLSRRAHRNYEKATFSFEFALRDDPTKKIGNDWDLQYGSVPNHFHVTMVSDDRSQIVDLGKASFETLDLARLPKLPATLRPQRDFVPAMVGHVYVVHTVDRNTDLYAMFRVDQINPDQSCDISWKRIQAPGSAEPKKAVLQAQP